MLKCGVITSDLLTFELLKVTPNPSGRGEKSVPKKSLNPRGFMVGRWDCHISASAHFHPHPNLGSQDVKHACVKQSFPGSLTLSSSLMIIKDHLTNKLSMSRVRL